MSDQEKRQQAEIISRNLRRLLDSHQMNQAELGKILDVSESTVGKWVLGRNVPNMGNIQRMAEYFRVQVSDIVDDKDIEEFGSLIEEGRILMDALPHMSHENQRKLKQLFDLIEDRD